MATYHITPLVINSLGGTHTLTYTDFLDKTNSKNQVHTFDWCTAHLVENIVSVKYVVAAQVKQLT